VLASIAGFLADDRTPDATTFRLEDLTPARPSTTARALISPAASLVLALVGLVTVGQAGGVVGALYGWLFAFGVELSPFAGPARSRVHWPGAAFLLRGIASWGLLLGLALGLLVGLTVSLAGGLVYGLIVALALPLAERLVAKKLSVSPARLDDGWRTSKTSVIVQAMVAALLGVLSFGAYALLADNPLVDWVLLGLIFGIVSGLMIALPLGGWYLVLQARLRRQAVRRGQLPPNPVSFLEAAVDTKVLRRTGGGVQFRHRLIADQLTRPESEPSLAALRDRLAGTDPEDSPRRRVRPTTTEPDADAHDDHTQPA
jgi:MFS family permease